MTRTMRSSVTEPFNPVLYEPRFARRIRSPTGAYAIAQKQEFFDLDDCALGLLNNSENLDLLSAIRRGETRPEDRQEVMFRIRHAMVSSIAYAHNTKDSPSLRTAKQVLAHRKGNCIEHGVLLYALARACSIPCRAVVALNPPDYCWTNANPGHHLFVKYSIGGDRFVTDPNRTYREEDLWCCPAIAMYSPRQFVSFLLGKSAERIMTTRPDPDAARDTLALALAIDPMQYTHYLSLASIADMYDDRTDMDVWCAKARACAPQSGDVEKFIGDLQSHYDWQTALTSYVRAVQKRMSRSFHDDLFMRIARL